VCMDLSSADVRVWQLGQRAMSGMATVPKMSLCVPLKGELAHEGGTCKPCVFNLRGLCQDSAEMCRFCHEPHDKTKRANRKVRKQRQQIRERARTPSPEPAWAR
ncbi:unnamed protein product, partial [Polarella glacialis]